MKNTANPALRALEDGAVVTEHPDYWEVSMAPMESCALAGAVKVIGDRPSLMILREMYAGVTRFDDMQRALGMSRTVLADRLAKLVDAGILKKEPYREEGQRTRFEYRLSRKGVGLVPAIIALAQWGKKHELAEVDEDYQFFDRETDTEIRAALVNGDGEVISDFRRIGQRLMK